MKTIFKISFLGFFFVLVVLLDVLSLHLVPDAYAIYGTRRRTARRTAVVVGSATAASAGAATAAAQQQTAAAQQQAATAEQEAAAAKQAQATAEQEAAAAQAEAEAAKQQAAAAQAGALPIGTVVNALPEGCTQKVIGGVQYYQCGSNYYRAAFQGSQLVYITAQPQ